MTTSSDPRGQVQPRKIRADGIFRSPHFLPSDYGYQAAWLHAPDDLQVRGTILILPPFGLDYTHSHRSLLHLADRLAMLGFAALRIDYVGTGDSSGDESSISAADDWIQGAVVALRALGEAFPDSPPSIIGLRHGALLAAAAATHVDVTDFVGWAPVDRSQGIQSDAGRPHAIFHQEDGNPNDVEAESFRIPDDPAERLAEIDISKLELRIEGSCLILRPSDRLGSGLWVQRMQQLGIASDDLEQSDLNAMMLEHRDGELPHQTLSTLTSWVSRTPATTAQFSEDAYLSYVRCMAPLNVQGWAERHVVIEAGDRSLVGVFSEPDHLEDVARVVLLPNSGSLNHIGPNRLGVKLSRELAKVGVATLRFDLGELVTSRARRPDEQSDPNPETTLADVAACVTWVCDHRPDVSISIADLCSEDQTALRAAMDLPSSAIDHVVSINPLSLQIAGDAICHGRTVVDGTPWQRLDSGEPYVRSILKSLSQRVTLLTVSSLRYIEDVLGVRSHTTLRDNLRKIIAQDRSIDLVFSPEDPGRELLTRQAGLLVKQLQRDGELSMHVVDSADHTFSRKAALHHIVRAVVAQTSLRLTRIPLGDDGWSHLAQDWTDLFQATGETSAFLAPAWIKRWLESLTESETGTGLIWHNSFGNAVAACVLTESRGRVGGFPVRRTFLNASGEGSPGCEHNDILALPAYRYAAYESLSRIIEDERQVDDFALPGVRTSLTNWLRTSLGQGSWEGFRSESPYVDLDKLRAAGTDYLSALSGNTRSQIRKSLRRYEAEFGDRYVHRPETRDLALTAFDTMLELHDLRWASLGTPSGFTEASRTFHRELINDLWSEGERSNELKVDIVTVGFGDHLMGVIYSLICRGHVQFFQSGLVYHEDRRLKPGLACHALAIEHYLGLGASEYDFLGGEPQPVQYKTSLSTDLRYLEWGHLELGTRRIKALGVARAMKRRLSLFAE